MLKTVTRMAFALAFAAWLIPAGPAQARNELTVTAPDGAQSVFSYDELAKMPVTDVKTTTPWTEGKHVFTGVSFADLFKSTGISSGTVRVSALNDYSVTVPVDRLVETGAILAYQFDGKAMSVRDKGPYWVIFPFDSDPSFQTDQYWSYAVWQVKSVNAQP
ncbi:molybdopterin-dependent oxidoreductase [Thalassospira marina]|uniref:Oxidoreductase molybdopterin-binding domain-containing protein n=1 Tax=Thalassospira marina TaxID=2048283 RepID=A0ABM6QDA4_9PROT|nr:molybdopterin-dependent oxidoreductase [Thalassospira marina]AUG54518.1 hypothetical protein CSC3H3_18710 [Thalassospira marina]